MTDRPYHAIATLTDTVSNAAVTEVQIIEAKRAVISCLTRTMMLTWDGTDPTATLGHPIVPSVDWAVVEGTRNVTRIKILALVGADGVVTVTLER
jgi:hypothetical protein